jgi:hypothetical protein
VSPETTAWVLEQLKLDPTAVLAAVVAVVVALVVVLVVVVAVTGPVAMQTDWPT